MEFSFVSNGIISILENILLIDTDLDASKSMEMVELEFCELEQDRSNIIVDMNNIVFINLFFCIEYFKSEDDFKSSSTKFIYPMDNNRLDNHSIYNEEVELNKQSHNIYPNFLYCK